MKRRHFAGAALLLPIAGAVRAQTPEIAVYGNNANIVDGDSSPDSADGTQFGTVDQNASVTKTRAEVRAEVIRALAEVHINDPERVANQYPHELSGGMQQRAMIAMALACNPKILVADEPTTALDVTIQKEIMDLLARLRRERGMSIVLITHNFGIIANFADKVAVMWKGRIVESGPVEQIMRTQSHPYTKALIACIPRLGQRRRRLTTLSDELKVSR